MQAVQEQFPTEKGYKTVCRNFFKFKNRKKLHIKLTHDQHTDQEYIVAWEPSIAQVQLK